MYSWFEALTASCTTSSSGPKISRDVGCARLFFFPSYRIGAYDFQAKIGGGCDVYICNNSTAGGCPRDSSCLIASRAPLAQAHDVAIEV